MPPTRDELLSAAWNKSNAKFDAAVRTCNGTAQEWADSIVDGWNPERPYPNDNDYQRLKDAIAHAIDAARYVTGE